MSEGVDYGEMKEYYDRVYDECVMRLREQSKNRKMEDFRERVRIMFRAEEQRRVVD